MNRFYIFLISTLFSANIVFSQENNENNSAKNDYLINVYNDSTIYTCNGYFYDSGGGAGNYQIKENYIVTFCPGIPGAATKVKFSLFNLGIGDNMKVYDGYDVNKPLIGTYSLDNILKTVQSSGTGDAPTGCLTFEWSSDASSVNEGWKGIVNCVIPCQTFYMQIDSINIDTSSNNNIINLCQNDSIYIKISGNYPNNNLFYPQSDQTSSFVWQITRYLNGETHIETLHSKDLNYKFENSGIYNIQSVVKDSTGCYSSNSISYRIIIMPKPKFKNVIASVNTLCTYDTATLQGSFELKKYDVAKFKNDSTYFIDDLYGVHVNSSVKIDIFNESAKITSPNDIKGIYAKMEHSWQADIDIKIICPTGKSVLLKKARDNNDVSPNCFMGEPNDPDCGPGSGTPGIGYSYSWSPNPQFRTMSEETGSFQYTYTGSCGNTYTSHNYLPAGSYGSKETLAGLIGCPLNGKWSLEVTDFWAIDNGYLFGWGLEFDSLLYPPVYFDSLYYNIANWSGNGVLSHNQNTTIIQPTIGGLQNYTYQVSSNLGCSYDTTISINVLNSPLVELGNDTSICFKQPLKLSAPVSSNYRYLWSTGDTTSYIFVKDSVVAFKYFSVEVTDINGCSSKDSIRVEFKSCNSVEDILSNITVKIYPNPVNDNLFVEINNNNKTINLSLIDINSKTVFDRNYSSDFKSSIDLKELPSGIYNLLLKSDKFIKSYRIIKN